MFSRVFGSIYLKLRMKSCSKFVFLYFIFFLLRFCLLTPVLIYPKLASLSPSSSHRTFLTSFDHVTQRSTVEESEVADGEIMGVCMQYGHTEGSCCGGCASKKNERGGEDVGQRRGMNPGAKLADICLFSSLACGRHLFEGTPLSKPVAFGCACQSFYCFSSQ